MHYSCSDNHDLFSGIHRKIMNFVNDSIPSSVARRLAAMGFASVLAFSALSAVPVPADAVPAVKHDLATENNIVTDAKSPSNAHLNLYDYWMVEPDTVDAPAYKHCPQGWRDKGINAGHHFQFSGQDSDGNGDSTSINAWMTNSRPLEGIVQDKLGADGYPVLVAGNDYYDKGGERRQTEAQSLGYLFNSDPVAGKRVYSDVRGLVQYVNGYYTYDSDKNYAEYDEASNKFTLYKKPAVKRTSGEGKIGGFFPFNPASDVFNKTGVQADGTTITQKSVKADSETMRHYFGVELTVDFSQPRGGMVGNKDMIFNFSGDDDVWVFIDGVLVGDLGGIHDAAELDINFRTGKITAKGVVKGKPWTREQGTLASRYKTALGEEKAAEFIEGDTFKDESYHTMKFFYLERGNNESNMRLTFNLKRVAQSSVQKDDQDGRAVQGAEFALYSASRTGTEGAYTYEQKDLIWQGVTDAAGIFKIMTPDGKRPYDFAEAYKSSHRQEFYILRELKAPDGYRPNPEAHLRYVPSRGDGQKGFLVSENPWDSGVYARPNQTTYVNDQNVVKDVQGKSHNVTDKTTVLAVVYKRDRTHDDWHPVGGSHGKWSVAPEGLKNVAQLNELYRKGFVHTFELNGDSWSVDFGDLPGSPRDYRFMAGQGDEIEYSIGYYLVDMPRAELDKRLAAGEDPITQASAVWLDSTGKEHNFVRESYARLHVTDCRNDLAIRKVDDAGMPVKDVSFQLFSAAQMQEGAQGVLVPKPGQIAVQEVVTGSDGMAYFRQIQGPDKDQAARTYYVVEKAAPKGYEGIAAPICVVVDPTGVYADAGVVDDGVTVTAGVGTLIDSMDHFASNDGVEVTLHDIIAQLRVAELANSNKDPFSYWIHGWGIPAAGASADDLYLRYNDDSEEHDYIQAGSNKPQHGVSFTADEGMIRANVRQDPNPCVENHGIGTWDDLGDKDITNLFTGSTVINVTNRRVASFEVKKLVKVPAGLTGPNLDTVDFAFTFDLRDRDGRPLSGEFDARVFNGSGDQMGSDFKISNGREHSIKHGETLRVYGLPAGAHVKVSEVAGRMPDAFVQTSPVDSQNKPLAGEGTVEPGTPVQLVFENAYKPAPVTLARTALKVHKDFIDGAGKPAWSVGFAKEPAFLFVLQANEGAPMPDDAVVGDDGRARAMLTIDKAADDHSASFKPITYTAPGVYTYVLYEKTPDAADRIPGVSYSDAAYRAKVTVADDANGALRASVELTKLADDQGNSLNGGAGELVEPVEGVRTTSFTNTFKLDEVQAGPLASKYLDGRDFAVDPDGSGEFTFRMDTAGPDAATQPMPKGCMGAGKDRHTIVSNSRTAVAFGQSTYKVSDLKGPDHTAQYYYELSEVIPGEAVNADGVRWDAATPDQKMAGGFAAGGMTFDATRYVARVSLKLVDNPTKRTAQDQAIVATIDYFKVTKYNDDARWTGSTADLTPVPSTPNGANRVEFHNSYRASTKVAGVDLTKTLDGRDMADGEFSFVVQPGRDHESQELFAALPGVDPAKKELVVSAPGSTSGKPSAAVNVLDITFDQSHAGKDFTFFVREATPRAGAQSKPGMAGGWDRSVYRVVYSVKDDHLGSLSVATKLFRVYGRDGLLVNKPVALTAEQAEGLMPLALGFNNEYRTTHTYGGIQVTKTLIGKNMKDGEFSFELTPVDEPSKIKMDERGLLAPDAAAELSFTSPAARSGVAAVMEKLANLAFTQADSGKTFAYTIKEVVDAAADDNDALAGVQIKGVTYDRSEFRVTITPHDDGAGKLKTITRVERLTDTLSGEVLSVPELIGTWDSAEDVEPKAAAAYKVPTVPFVNRYQAAPTPASYSAFTKRLQGREWTEADSFTFDFDQVAYFVDGVSHKPGDAGFVQVDIPSVTVDAHTQENESGYKLFGFKDVMFSTEGVYTYKLRERIPDDAVNKQGVPYRDATPEQKKLGGFTKDGVVYSSREVSFTFTVLDFGDGDYTVLGPIVGTSPQADGAYFTNTADSVMGQLEARKTLTGRVLKEGEFHFVLSPHPDAIEHGNEQPIVSTNDSQGKVVFNKLSFAEAGTYTYTLSEVSDEPLPGVTYDKARYTVVAEVDGGAAGQRVEFKVFDEQGRPVSDIPEFRNAYEAKGSIALRTKKTLSGRPLEQGEFSFELKAGSKVVKTAANSADGTVDFGTIDYTIADLEAAVRDGYATRDAQGVWHLTYTASEVVSDLPGGVSAVSPAVTFRVDVVDNGDGTLKATLVSTSATGFENVYAAAGEPVASTLTGRKDLVYDEGLSPDSIEGKFTFTVTAEDGTPMPEHTKASNAADGTVDFGSITFTLDDLNRKWAQEHPVDTIDGTEAVAPTDARIGKPRSVSFEYAVTETGSVAGVTNDEQDVRTVRFTLTDDGNGHLTVTRDPETGPAFVFTNRYAAGAATDQIVLTKQLAGRPPVDGEFTFALVEQSVGEEGPTGTVLTAVNDAQGKVAFPRITYTKPGSHVYTIAEVDEGTAGIIFDSSVYTVFTTVVDNGDGTLAATHEIVDESGAKVENMTFSNAYEPRAFELPLAVNKVMDGRALKAGEFTFELVGEDGKVVQSSVNDRDGNVVFKPLRFTADDLSGSQWVDQNGTMSRSEVFNYMVREVVPGDAVNAEGVRWDQATAEQRAAGGFAKDDVIYDGRTFTADVIVSDNGSGFLLVKVSWDKTPVFVNTYDPHSTPGPNPGHPTPKPPAIVPQRPGGGDILPATGDTRSYLPIAALGLLMGITGILVRRRLLSRDRIRL